jgi:hypothetical protein
LGRDPHQEAAKQEKADKLPKDKAAATRQNSKLSNPSKAKAVRKFAKKYPQFVKLGKIAYPIEDLVLVQDPLLHQVNSSCQRPSPSALSIPPHLLGDLLYITDFCWTFKGVIGLARFSVEHLYCDLQRSEPSPLLKELHQCLVRTVLESCLSKENESQLFPDSHLSLLCRMTDIIDIGAAVSTSCLMSLGALLRSPLWKTYTEGSKELVTMLKHKLNAAPIEDFYYSHFSYEERVALLVFAVHCLFDTKALHEEQTRRLEERDRLAKQRQVIKTEIRATDVKGKRKGKHSKKKHSSSDKVERLREKLSTVTERLSEISVRTQSLGLDRDYNEYFLFNCDRSRLYVSLASPLVPSPKVKVETGYWYAYATKAEVKGVLRSLSLKGVREAKLHEGMTSALAKLNFEAGEAESTSEDSQVGYSNKYSSFDPVDCSFEGVRSLVISVERGFTNHLAKTSKQWDLPVPRSEWHELVTAETTAEGLAQLLLELGTKANTPFKTFPITVMDDRHETGVSLHHRRVNLRIWQDFGESFSLWAYLVSTCKTLSSLHSSTYVFERVLQSYYRKRPDRTPLDSKKRPEEANFIRTRRSRRTEDLKDEDSRKRFKGWEHDDVCFFCDKYGELMCCETCARVVHPTCIGLETVPLEDWFCDECLSKQEAIPKTRSRSRLRKLA